VEFKDRLKEYRESLGLTKKRDMADKLSIGDSFYNLLESGGRDVSKNILKKLSVMSGKNESYWKYGIGDTNEYLNSRGKYSSLDKVISQLKEVGQITKGIPTARGWDLIKEGLTIDLEFMELEK